MHPPAMTFDGSLDMRRDLVYGNSQDLQSAVSELPKQRAMRTPKLGFCGFVAALGLFVPHTVAAQNTPKVEAFGGYSYLRLAEQPVENFNVENLAAETSTGVTANFKGSGNTIANPKPAPSRFEVEDVRPAIRSGDSPSVDTNGQLPSFGGPLQFYANLPNLSAWSNGYIGVSRGKTPFGGDIILPFWRGRAEMFGGVAGVYVLMGTRITRPYTWLTQTKLGWRVALDPEHHVWLGATGYYLTNFAEKTRQWASGSADLTIRFGR
jgi:hypothetical protein